MKDITQWQHFKKNYLWVTLFQLGMAILALFTAETPLKYYVSGAFLAIIGIVFIGNYYSWKRKP